jgi:hypothetical protein
MKRRRLLDIHYWIMNIIDSCETLEQAYVAERCVFNFLKNYNGANKYMTELLRILEKYILQVKNENLIRYNCL